MARSDWGSSVTTWRSRLTVTLVNFYALAKRSIKSPETLLNQGFGAFYLCIQEQVLGWVIISK